MKKYEIKFCEEAGKNIIVEADSFYIDDFQNVVFEKESATILIVQRNYYMYVRQVED